MRIRTFLLAASVAALPALAMAQTAPPTVATPPTAAGTPSAAPDKEHHERGEHRKEHAEFHAKYEKLSAADKAKFDDLSKQVRQLRDQQRQILGMSKS
jgi:Spy/CpxP family protein refolding chaperone